MHERESALQEWLLHTIKDQDFMVTPLAGDASFRKYFRVHHHDTSYVVMDAPPGKEDPQPFIRIANTLEHTGILAPKILAVDLQQGFLLLSDLGDHLLLQRLNAENADTYYSLAMNTLSKIQSCPTDSPLLAAFDASFMLKEMSLCPEWFLKAYLGLTLSTQETLLLQQSMEWIATEVSKQPVTFIHRDYHSRNLMLVSQNGEQDLAVIDFQDAMIGPITYDLVSLLKDCYISWPRAKILQWVESFYAHNTQAHYCSLAEFIRAFDFCGLQRHLKVLGIFCRLHLRDNKPGYLKDLALTLRYVLECTETYDALHPLYHFLQTRVYLP